MVIGPDIEIVSCSAKQFDVCGRQVRKPKLLADHFGDEPDFTRWFFGWTSKLFRQTGNDSMSADDK
jgi:hypothetical protein